MNDLFNPENLTDEAAAAIGRAFMEKLPRDYCWDECPTEWVFDMLNERAAAAHRPPERGPTGGSAMNDPMKREAWMVESNTDLTEGRGSAFPLHICATEAVARRLARKAYVMGSDAPIVPITLIQVDGRWFGPVVIQEPTNHDEAEQRVLDARRDAVAKARAAGLTDDEIAAISRH